MKKIFYSIFCSLLIAAIAQSCGKDDEKDSGIPKVATKEISTLRTRSAVGGGAVESSSGGEVIDRGVCWSTEPNPTLLDSYTNDGTGLGAFNSQITGLQPNTEYYVRAFAVNNVGIAYGNEVFFKTLVEVIPPENFWYVVDRPYISNSLGSVWSVSTKSIGSLSSDGGIISIVFEDKPISNKTYKVVVGSVKKDDMSDDECGIGIVAPGYPDLLISTGLEGNVAEITIVNDNKLKISFDNIEMQYVEGGETKKVTVRGILLEK